MPQVVVTRVIHALNDRAAWRSAIRQVLVVGVSYKPNVRDYRESPAIECMRHLLSWGARVSYVDPLSRSCRFDDARRAPPPDR